MGDPGRTQVFYGKGGGASKANLFLIAQTTVTPKPQCGLFDRGSEGIIWNWRQGAPRCQSEHSIRVCQWVEKEGNTSRAKWKGEGGQESSAATISPPNKKPFTEGPIRPWLVWGIERLMRQPRQKGMKGVTHAIVKRIHTGQTSGPLHSRTPPVPRNPTLEDGVDDQCQADLDDMQALSRENN